MACVTGAIPGGPRNLAVRHARGGVALVVPLPDASNAQHVVDAQARRSVRAARAPVVGLGGSACQSVGRLARGRRTCRPAGRMNGSPETCNVIHYQTIGKRKAGRHATLFIIKPSASEKSPSVIGPVSSTDGVCIGILRSEANSQQTEIDREIKMHFNK